MSRTKKSTISGSVGSSGKRYIFLALLLFVPLFSYMGLRLLHQSDAAPGPTTADTNNDGVINIFDLSFMLSHWGSENAQADVTGDGVVNILDLSFLLSQWGNESTQVDADIVVSPDATIGVVDRRILGINAPAWLGSSRFDNATFQQLTSELQSPLVRLPGGSWSNGYRWLEAEQDDPWFASPSDFIPMIQAAQGGAMWTANQNETPQEAAALVAFFNSEADDTTVIGTDRNGVNWGAAGQWAQLRASAGYPSPVRVEYWEVGNEIYGGREGTDCTSFGWEDVWTCDGREYVNGLGEDEGFLDFASAMKQVDATIKVGAVGVRNPYSWGNFGVEVIEEAGSAMDFYIVHHYQWNTPPADPATFLADVTGTWGSPVQTLRGLLPSTTEIAVTEYNAAAFWRGDTSDMMSRAVASLHIAETIGEFAENGIEMATHWDLANGTDGSSVFNYSLIEPDTFERSPQYWALAFWGRMGGQLLATENSYDPASEVRVFATRLNADTLQLLILNKQDQNVETTISVPGALSASSLVASALDPLGFEMTINGQVNPSVDIESIPRQTIPVSQGQLDVTLSPTSLQLLTIQM